MAKYSPDKDYTNQMNLNIQWDDFNCPCCGKRFPITEAELEKFELSREFVFNGNLVIWSIMVVIEYVENVGAEEILHSRFHLFF